MKITDIYTKYKIMPSLQLHQLRVAAVATQIAQKSSEQLDLDAIKTATLLHDMGNIIKFNLSLFPDFLEPEGLEYWQVVKDEFQHKYGTDEHDATYAIAKELRIGSRAMELLESIGFAKAPQIVDSADIAKWIACYSDHRVTPTGITPLEERMQSGRQRFASNKGLGIEEREAYEKRFATMSDAMRKIEAKIFKQVDLSPEQITDRSVQPIIKELQHFDIGSN